MNAASRFAVVFAVASLTGCRPVPPSTKPSEPLRAGELPPPANVPTGTVTPPTPADSPVVATVNDAAVSAQSLSEELRRSYGLNVLMILMQREMARTEARKQNIVVGPADFAAERLRMMKQIAPQAKPDEYDRLILQLVQRENGSLSQFEALVETNAYLRRLARPIIEAAVTEEAIRARFNAVFGERVHVRHIELANLQDAARARARIEAGENFEAVARAMSLNETSGPTGGDLKPFARHTPGLPQAFVETAFALQKPGDLSSPVQDGTSFHLLQLVERLAPPPLAKYEDVHDSLREQLVDEGSEALAIELRKQFAEAARQAMVINDPILAAEFKSKLAAREANVQNRERLRTNLDDRRRAETQPVATQPAAAVVPATAVPTSTAPATTRP